MEKIMNQEATVKTEGLLKRLLNRRTFQWPESEPSTIGSFIAEKTKIEAKDRINFLNQGTAISPLTVIEKVEPRATSWQFQELLTPYRKYMDSPLDNFLNAINEANGRIKAAIESFKPEEEVDSLLINQQWIVNTLGYETRVAIKRKARAEQEKNKLRKEVLAFGVQTLKQSPDNQYGDMFNRMVCERLDVMEKAETVPTGVNKFRYVESVIRGEMGAVIGDPELEKYLEQKLREQKEKRLSNFLQRGTTLLEDQEKALVFAALMFELDQRKTDATWQEGKLENVIINGLKEQPISLISMLCCINQFDLNGGYILVPDLFAYQESPELEPVPLIVDELMAVARFIEFYGIKVNLTIYVSNTDYTEIGQFGEVKPSNLKNLEKYLSSLREYVSSKKERVQVLPISVLTDNNPLYDQVKARILEKVTKFEDQDFTREWYPKFEQACEKVYESQVKRKLFSPKEIGGKSQEITRNIWAVNAAQGAVFASLRQNTIFISTERRERDRNYIIDKSTGGKFPPVLYILQVAEAWNRKLTGKFD